MRVSDQEIEKALDQLSQAMGNEKTAREYEKLWDKARYDGKPQYIDGVVMSGHIFEKSITEMRTARAFVRIVSLIIQRLTILLTAQKFSAKAVRRSADFRSI